MSGDISSDDAKIRDWISRNLVPSLCAVSMALAAFIGTHMYSQMQDMSARIQQMQIAIARLETKLDMRVSMTQNFAQVP